jgi:exodeoxyribonuclease VII small subunit
VTVDGHAEDEGRTFEQLVEALEQLTEQMAAGDIGIEEAADLYERAQLLHALATERLQRVQERIEKLTPGEHA